MLSFFFVTKKFGISDSPDALIDNNGFEIEGFGFSDNLMLLGCLEHTGYPEQPTVYDSCLDVVDWISKNCPSDACLELED